MALDESRYSQSLVRAFAILEQFSPERPVQGIAEIAGPLGMSHSTTHRYVSTMAALGYMEQTRARTYRLGLRLVHLGLSALSAGGLRDRAEPLVVDLRDRTGYSANLGVLDGGEVVFLVRARSFRRGKYGSEMGVGSRLPAYCTAMGKVLLASLPVSSREEILGEMELRHRGPHTVTSKKALRTELKLVRGERIAVNDQELCEGLIAIAAGVRDLSGEVVASVSLTANTGTISLEAMVDAFGAHLTTTADQISARLGYRRDDEVSR